MNYVKVSGTTSNCKIKLQPFSVIRLRPAEHCSDTACWAIIHAIWFVSILVIGQTGFGSTLAFHICAQVYWVQAKTACWKAESTI